MNAVFSEVFRLLGLALGSGRPAYQIVLIGVVSVVGYILVLGKVSDALKAPVNSAMRSAVALVLSLVLILVVTAAANVFAGPSVGRGLRTLLPIIVAITMVFAAAIPATCLLHKLNYLSALISTLLAIAAVVVLRLLICAGFDAITAGGKGLVTTKKRTSSVQKLIDE